MSTAGPSGPVRPFTGASTGCTVADPTGTGGCVTPAMAWLLNETTTVFGPMPTSCWDEHAWNPRSDHPRGKACDVFPGRGGVLPSAEQKARGDALAASLQTGAAQTGVSYLIWYGQQWSVARADEGWRPYGGGGVYDPASVTGGHFDHVHISVQ